MDISVLVYFPADSTTYIFVKLFNLFGCMTKSILSFKACIIYCVVIFLLFGKTVGILSMYGITFIMQINNIR